MSVVFYTGDSTFSIGSSCDRDGEIEIRITNPNPNKGQSTYIGRRDAHKIVLSLIETFNLNVEQSIDGRCRNCRRYTEYYEQVTNYNRRVNACLDGYVRDQGPDFGCVHFEMREGR
jgi:hypothetical protein